MKTQKNHNKSCGRICSLLALILAAGGIAFSAPAFAQQARTPQKYCEELEANEGPGTCEDLGIKVVPGWAAEQGGAAATPIFHMGGALVEWCDAGQYRIRTIALPQTITTAGGRTKVTLNGGIDVGFCP